MILIDFLARIVLEANILKMFDIQTVVALLTFLVELAKSQCEAGVEMVATEESAILSWLKSEQYLLRKSAQASYINGANVILPSMIQKTFKTEREFSTRLNNTVCRCGNMHTPVQKIIKFIDGLHLRIRSIVARTGKSNQIFTYLEFIEFCKKLLRGGSRS